MSRWRHCNCARCRCRGLMGPAILITLGVLFFIGQYSWNYSFDRLWPILLIVIGVVLVISHTASTEGHVSWPNQYPPPPPPPPGTPPPPMA